MLSRARWLAVERSLAGEDAEARVLPPAGSGAAAACEALAESRAWLEHRTV